MKEAERRVTVNHVTITTQAGNTHQSYKCLAQPIVTDTGSTSRMNDEQHAQLNKGMTMFNELFPLRTPHEGMWSNS